ncbi:MAG: chorismate synthase [Candidatus Marinimicrobia bacterium]|nr:chorismate synthase [Candidatus Neomarinimicrobiota bacterium]
MLARIKYLTAGESHGKGLLGIIDGLPAVLVISENYMI